MQSANVQTVEVGPIRLAYTESGSGEPVIFVHGIPTDLRAWNAQVEPFSKRYRVITYSRRMAHPNHNDVDYHDSTVEHNSEDLLGLLQELDLSPVHLVGHSYGGFVAAYCAARNPEVIRTLVLVEPAIGTVLVRNRKNPLQLLSLLFKSPSTARSAFRYQRKFLDPSLAAFAQGDFDAALRLNLDGIMNKERAFGQFPEPVRVMLKENEKTVAETGTDFPAFGKELSSMITAPTLLINGANGIRVFEAIVEKLAAAIPNSETAKVSGSAHFPHMENPEEFNSLVLEFLAKHS